MVDTGFAAISGIAMAMAMFASNGFPEVTISQVAEAAGLSKMTVTTTSRARRTLSSTGAR